MLFYEDRSSRRFTAVPLFSRVCRMSSFRLLAKADTLLLMRYTIGKYVILSLFRGVHFSDGASIIRLSDAINTVMIEKCLCELEIMSTCN